ncbi:MAG: hypothetical protein QG656_374 [Candidatus Hydrogenedentes bacterium]|nr:hypothetical protein [Candidatus Hydrogenedentota bacterium]
MIDNPSVQGITGGESSLTVRVRVLDGVCVQCKRVLRRYHPETKAQADELKAGLRLIGLLPYHYETANPLLTVADGHAPHCPRAA